MRDKSRPADAVYVGRPSKWGNPYTVKQWGRGVALHMFKNTTLHELKDAARKELKGKHLVCWCAPSACHADLLLEVANETHKDL